MTDRRLTPATTRIAHASLRGRIDAPAYTEGTVFRIAQPVADLCDGPGGARDRQVLFGARFLVIDRQEGFAFGRAEADGYCGWILVAALAPGGPAATHRIAAPASVLLPEARTQAREIAILSAGSQVTVIGRSGKFAETTAGFLPESHLQPLDQPETDPVAVAERLLGTPYLWGGNSRFGIDCSGLVQLAFHACGRPCPGDSDLQRSIGRELLADEPLQRGDLLFWKGHVALQVDRHRLIHANGASMSVAYENTDDCIARILAADGTPVLMRRRP